MAAKSEEHRGDARVVAKSPCRHAEGVPIIITHLRCGGRPGDRAAAQQAAPWFSA